MSANGKPTRSSNGVTVQLDYSMADTPPFEALSVRGPTPIAR